MSIQPINIGTDPNDGTGDPLRTAFEKVNANTAEQQAAIALKADQTALDAGLALKADLASPTFTGTVGGITKAMVGLGNAANLAPADYPVSTAQAVAIAARYGKNNILGTVSQSAGVPTGAVIERGSNANGSYVRWADGTQICTRTITVLGTGWATMSPTGSYSPVASGNFAAAFSSTPTITATGADGNISARSAYVTYVVASATGVTDLYMASHVAPVSSWSTDVSITAIGRWF